MSLTLRSTALIVSSLAIMAGTASVAFASAGSTPPSGRAMATSSGSGKPSVVCVTKTPNGIAVKACKPTTPISLGKAHAQAG